MGLAWNDDRQISLTKMKALRQGKGHRPESRPTGYVNALCQVRILFSRLQKLEGFVNLIKEIFRF
jgi:hypothetical protein